MGKSKWTLAKVVTELEEYVESARTKRARELFEALLDDASKKLRKATNLRRIAKGMQEFPAKTGAFMLIAAVLLPLDVPLQGLLMHAGMPDLSTMMSAIAGLAIVGIITALAHGWYHGWLLDEERPGRAKRIATSVAGVGFLVFLVSSGFAAFALRIWDASLAARLDAPAQLSILVAAEAGVFSGSLFGAAAWPDMRRWFAARRFERMQPGIRKVIEAGNFLASQLGENAQTEWTPIRNNTEQILQEGISI
jgi:hypothetical protein